MLSSADPSEQQPLLVQHHADTTPGLVAVVNDAIPGDVPPLPLPNTVNPSAIIRQPVDVSQMAVAPPQAQGNHKCSRKGCPKLPYGHAFLTCELSECGKEVHRLCYEHMIKKSKKHNITFDDKVFCTVAHQEQFCKTHLSENYNWSNDGKDGKDDPHSSEYYLIKWLNTDENFNSFRDPKDGCTKLEIATSIANFINSKGVRVQRNGEQVKHKIDHIQKSMREATR